MSPLRHSFELPRIPSVYLAFLRYRPELFSSNLLI